MPLVDPSDPLVFHNNWIRQVAIANNKRVVVNYHRAGNIALHQKRAQKLIANLPIVDGESVLIVGAGFNWTGEFLDQLLPNSTVIGTDNSPWVQNAKGESETAEYRAAITNAGLNPDTEPGATILARIDDGGARARKPVHADDISTGQGRVSIKQKFGLTGNQKIDWGISEQVLPWLDDSECLSLSDAGHKICNQVAHVLTPYFPNSVNNPEPPPLWNWKYITQADRDANGPVRADLLAEPWYTEEVWKVLLPNDLIVGVGDYVVV